MTRQLFCRPVPPEHDKFADAVYGLARSPKEEYRAIGLNLIYDHRVSPNRAHHFIGFVNHGDEGTDLTEQSILDGLRDYRIAFAATPEMSYDEGRVASSNYVEDHPNLVHICNVTSRLIVISGMSAGNATIREALTWLRMGNRALGSPTVVDEELRSKFVTEEGRQSFVKGFLELLNIFRAIYPWNPVWVTRWEDFSTGSAATITASWPETVGLRCSPATEWFLVLRLPAAEITRLYRPTQFEAGDFPYHFPSPPCAPLASGGHPMSLAPSIAHAGLLLEYVHTEIPFTFEGWTEAGRRIGSTPLNRRYDVLMTYRRRHHAILVDSYGARKIDRWMQDPAKYRPPTRSRL